MKTLGIVDLGTNSARLAVVRVDKVHHDTSTLALHKETIRLGQGEFAHNRITKPAMERGLRVLGQFADIARSYGASDIVVAATAALREAENRRVFVERAFKEHGIDVQIVSGLEEARLIYLGVASGVDLNSHTGFFIDIGGGTTELILGDGRDYKYLDSLKLGAIRLHDMLLKDKKGKISKKRYSKLQEYIVGQGSLACRKIADQGFDVMYGSSGTIMNLAEITAKRLGDNVTSLQNYVLRYSDLQETISILCDMDVESRKNVPGINSDRADIIISGAAILDTIMRETGASEIVISDRALRHGLLIDHLFQEDTVKERYLNISVRLRSIMQLCRACNFEEHHTEKVVSLALSIYDELAEMGLHPYGDNERELLRYAALVHDIGSFVSHVDHHKHSYYLIRNWALLGFTDEEIELLACTAMCHRKTSPKKACADRLSGKGRRLVEVLASILRIADSLDRSQLGVVKNIRLQRDETTNDIIIRVYATEDCPLEMWSLESKKKLFERTFSTDLQVRMGLLKNEGTTGH